MRVLISGGAGFIGSHTADAMRRGGHNVLVLDNFSTGKMDNLAEFCAMGGKFNHADVCIKEGDVSSFGTVAQIFYDFKPESVIHLAAQAAISTSIENPVRDLNVNGIGTINMLCAAKKYGAKRFVLASTSAVYKDNSLKMFKKSIDEKTILEPNTPYGISKLAAEMYTRTMFPNAVILRFGNVYGERQVPIGDNQLLSRMIRHFKFGDKFFIHGSGNQKRDFVHVSDVVQAITYAMYDNHCGTYNIATGQSVSVNEIAKLVENYYGVPGYNWDHTDKEDTRKQVCLDVSAAEYALNWCARVNIVDGVKRTIEWWEKYGTP